MAKYSLDFKIKVIEEYLTTNISYIDFALKYYINNGALIARWKLDYMNDSKGKMTCY